MIERGYCMTCQGRAYSENMQSLLHVDHKPGSIKSPESSDDVCPDCQAHRVPCHFCLCFEMPEVTNCVWCGGRGTTCPNGPHFTGFRNVTAP